jgi:hypothetical protein
MGDHPSDDAGPGEEEHCRENEEDEDGPTVFALQAQIAQGGHDHQGGELAEDVD